jgi:2,3-dihydroxybenzoate decarboxylase|tara:strand:+ start:358 stop:519 length:162 start_codon:yes stop_codon:yes gene_type:complete
MKGKIGIEEHFAIDETIQDSSPRFPGDSVWPELKSRLLDIQEKRVGFGVLPGS